MKATASHLDAADAAEQFRAAIQSAGLTPPDEIEADGKLRRFPSNGKRSDTAGWYLLHSDGIPAGSFGDWRTGFSQTWRADIGRTLTPAEDAAHRARVEAMRREREAEEAKRRKDAAIAASAIWEAATTAPDDHEYLARKGIKAHGLRAQDGRLVVPLRAGGLIHSLQYIGPDGDKRFLPGGRVTGCYFSIGSTQGAATLCIAEGFATAASIHEATGRPVAVAFNAGNLLPVAKALRERYPEPTLIICADDDVGTDGNPGLSKATEAAQAVDGLLAFPDFGTNRPDGATDFNDLATAQGPEAVRRCIEHASKPTQKNDGWQVPDPIDAEEWRTARLTPPCIVENYLYADVAVKAAPGGIGKTTVTLFEAVHIALGLPLYGLQIYKPGPVGILTAEDSREMLVARLRRIAEGMGLTAVQIAQVMRLVRISDVSGAGYRLTEIIADTVRPAAFADALAEGLAELAPVLVTIDPAVSFGVGESRVNDAEQGLIEAARRLRKALNCCIRYIHHTGKQNARDKTTDQYTGRGGSAFADGCRMVHILQPLDAAGWRKATGTDLEPGDNGLILARPKMSYCPPQGDILLRRRGYLFEHVEGIDADPMGALRRDGDALIAIMRELDHPTQNILTAIDTGLSRDRTRAVVRYLIDAGMVEYRENTQRGGAQKYLHVIETASEPPTFRAPADLAAGEGLPENKPSCAAAYREEKARAPSRGLSPCDPKASDATTRASSAHLAHLDGEAWESDL